MKIPIQIMLTNNRKVETIALIDSGAKGASFIDRDFAAKQKIPLKRLTKDIPILNADGTENRGGDICEYVKVTLEVEKRSCGILLLATSLGRETVILGYPWLQQEN